MEITKNWLDTKFDDWEDKLKELVSEMTTKTEQAWDDVTEDFVRFLKDKGLWDKLKEAVKDGIAIRTEITKKVVSTVSMSVYL